MASRSAIQKLQDVVVGTVKGAVKDPVGTAGKAVRQAKGGLAVGRAFVDQVSRSAMHRTGGGSTDASAPASRPSAPPTPAPEPEATPSDVARVVEKKAGAKRTTAGTTAAKKTTKKSTPSAKLPPKKAPAKKTAAKKATAKKATARKTAAKKSPPRKTAAEVLEDAEQEVTTPAGTTGADGGTNPDTTDTSLQQPGTEPLMDPATTKAVTSEAETGSRAADPEKG